MQGLVAEEIVEIDCAIGPVPYAAARYGGSCSEVLRTTYSYYVLRTLTTYYVLLLRTTYSYYVLLLRTRTARD